MHPDLKLRVSLCWLACKNYRDVISQETDCLVPELFAKIVKTMVSFATYIYCTYINVWHIGAPALIKELHAEGKYSISYFYFFLVMLMWSEGCSFQVWFCLAYYSNLQLIRYTINTSSPFSVMDDFNNNVQSSQLHVCLERWRPHFNC